MKRNRSLFTILALAILCATFAPLTYADNSHARIVRLSLVQGDVRFTRAFHRDPLADQKANWESAVLNLPIREGYALSTDAGRAVVEFENGAMAFLSENTIVEFYDLSLHDGDRITRLVLRQGAASFYVHPDHGDYFSVTGGDFTVEALNRTRFRLDNFDDGSSVNIQSGRATVLQNEKPTPLEKGQSFTVKALDAGNPILGRENDMDDFDKWVSGRVESVVTATNNTNQYVNSPNYNSGFGDLNSYGSWLSVGGYGYGWQPYGVGLGWSPFGIGYGGWYQDPFFGLTFIGSQPWGWLPYHYGGWVFSPSNGWVWIPSGFGLGYRTPVYFHPATATYVRTGATVGIVPVHPADKSGKTPLNLAQGVYPLQSKAAAQPVTVNAHAKVSVLKNGPSHEISASTLAATAAPARTSRTLTAARGGTPLGSTILYDSKEHGYVNSGVAPRAENKAASEVPSEAKSARVPAQTTARGVPPPSPSAAVARAVPARAPIAPAPARSSGGGSSGSGSSASRSSGATWSGRSSAASSGHSSTGSSAGGSHSGGGKPR